MSNKLVKNQKQPDNGKVMAMMSPPEIDPDAQTSPEDIKYMNGKPTRVEVANYVNALLEEHYMPRIDQSMQMINQGAKLGIMIMQAILIDKGICTGEEIEQFTHNFIEHQKEEIKKQQQENPPEQSSEADNKQE